MAWGMRREGSRDETRAAVHAGGDDDDGGDVAVDVGVDDVVDDDDDDAGQRVRFDHRGRPRNLTRMKNACVRACVCVRVRASYVFFISPCVYYREMGRPRRTAAAAPSHQPFWSLYEVENHKNIARRENAGFKYAKEKKENKRWIVLMVIMMGRRRKQRERERVSATPRVGRLTRRASECGDGGLWRCRHAIRRPPRRSRLLTVHLQR